MINNEPIGNKEKYETYKVLMKKMDIAKKYGFHFELCMIAYALIEDRTSASLRHAGQKDRDRLYHKIMALEKLLNNDGDKTFQRVYEASIFNEIDQWRKERNQLVHSMANMAYNTEKLTLIAEKGYDLSKRLSNMVTRYKRLKK